MKSKRKPKFRSGMVVRLGSNGSFVKLKGKPWETEHWPGMWQYQDENGGVHSECWLRPLTAKEYR